MMNDFISQIQARRSVRKFTGKKLTPEQMLILKESVNYAPSSCNHRPWQLVFVENRDVLADLALCKERGAGFLSGAALGIVVCADAAKSDVWIEDCSVVSIILQLTAQSLGLGSCWVQVRKRQHSQEQSAEKYVRERLNLPRRIRILSIIGVGYSA